MPAPDLSFIPTKLPATTGNPGLDKYTGASLDALKSAPTTDIFSSDAFAQIQKLLGPGAGGGLSPALMAMFSQGQKTNALNTSAAVAGAKSDAVGRGLEGSTVESQGVQNAKFTGSMADSNLMAQLFGLQNQNSGSLASMLFQGQQGNDAQIQDRLKMLLSILSGAGDSSANISMFREGLSAEEKAAKDAATSQLLSSIIGGGAQVAGAYLGGL